MVVSSHGNTVPRNSAQTGAASSGKRTTRIGNWELHALISVLCLHLEDVILFNRAIGLADTDN